MTEMFNLLLLITAVFCYFHILFLCIYLFTPELIFSKNFLVFTFFRDGVFLGFQCCKHWNVRLLDAHCF